MPMTNMQMSAEEAKEYSQLGAPTAEAPRYPYGLCLNLNDESLKKLGFDAPLPVGTEVIITAKAKVTRAGAREEADGDTCVDMELQVTDMEMATGARQSDPKAFYPNSTMN